MPTATWLGRQKKRKQIRTFQVTAYDAATTYGLGVPDSSGPTVTTIAAGSANATATALVAAWNAIAAAPFNRATASASTDTVTLTARTAGEPFTVAGFVVAGTGTMGTGTDSTTNQSPNDVNDAVNFSTGAVVANGDTLVFDNNDVDVLYNLGASANTPDAINVFGTWNAGLGLPKLNRLGNYFEYRSRYLTLKATTVNIGSPDGSGPNLYMHDNGATAGTWNIWGTGSNPEAEVPCALLLGSSASNALNVMGGSVGIAFFAGETANFSGGLNITGGTVTCGTGVTLSGITQSSGTLDTSSALGAVAQQGGSHVHRAGNITTLTINGGTFELRANAALTITNMTIGDGATLDLSLCDAAITVTNTATLKGAWTINDPNNCLGRGGSFVYTEPDGLGSGQLTRGKASATVTVA